MVVKTSLGVLAVSSVLALCSGSAASSENTVIGWEEAVARGLPVVEDFRNSAGLPYCEFLPGDDIPPGAEKPTRCFVRPEDQGLRIGDPLTSRLPIGRRVGASDAERDEVSGSQLQLPR